MWFCLKLSLVYTEVLAFKECRIDKSAEKKRKEDNGKPQKSVFKQLVDVIDRSQQAIGQSHLNHKPNLVDQVCF